MREELLVYEINDFSLNNDELMLNETVFTMPMDILAFGQIWKRATQMDMIPFGDPMLTDFIIFLK